MALNITQLKKKCFALFIVLLFSTLLVFVNIVAHQYDKRWDLTKARQHTLSESTIDYIKDLTKEVKMTALHVGIPPRYLEDMFKEYERRSDGLIKTEIIDPIVNIGYAAQFGNIITGKQKKIVVQSGVERRDIDFTRELLTEELLTNAIIRVTRESRNVYFLEGHQEYNRADDDDSGISILDKLLTQNNITTKSLFLETAASIPEDCDVLVIAGAKTHLTLKEKKIIQEYLKWGGDALFLIEHTLVTTPDKPLTEEELALNPSLNEILNNWGVRIHNDVVVDLASHASGDVGSPATNNYLSHRAIVAGLDYTFYVRPRSISLVSNRRKSLKVAPLVLTLSKEKSWGETDRTLKIQFDEILDRRGPVPIAFVIWETKEEEEPSDTRIIVFTDADFLTNAYIGSYSNAQMGLNAINWLSELDYKVFVDQKEFKVDRLDLTSKQKKLIIIILILMPVVIGIFGVGVWMQRK